MATMSHEEYRYNQLIKTFASEPEPRFESPSEQQAVWGRAWGCRSDVGGLRVVLMHRPGAELDVVDPAKRLPEIGAYGDVQSGWYWRGTTPPDLGRMQAQHDALAETLRGEGVEVVYVGDAAPGCMKQCYTRDSVVGVGGGAVVCRLGPRVRRGEELPVTRRLAALGVPILRTIHGSGILEGGSFAWINERTAVVGRSSRVNEEGARQLEEVLAVQDVELLRVDVPGYRLHIDGAFVMIDRDKALINPNILPFVFIRKLSELGVKTIEVHAEDHPFTVNCLAIAPGRVLMSESSSDTLGRLEKEGIEVLTLPYEAVTSGGGGIHCSTAPLLRDPL